MLNDNEMYNDEDVVPFPDLSDHIFTIKPHSHYNAQIHYPSNYDALYRYVEGYKEAGDRLVHSLLENNRHMELIVYPTLFLYRQYLELRLKQLLIEGNLLLDRSYSMPKTHRLDKLWFDCKRLFKEIEPNMTEQEIAGLEACITEFSVIDPGSMAFRYHVDTENNPSLPDNLHYINIPNIAHTMAKIHSFLDAMHMHISVSLDQKQEIEAALRDYYYPEEDLRDV